jgi:hypothetical protein
MKTEDIIKQLASQLPKHTDLFSVTQSVSSMTFSAGTVTVTTSTNHNLNNGALVVVNGALSPNTITSLTQVNGIATAVTTFDHDLTAGTINGENQTVNITGAADSEYNGDLTLIDVPNRRTFTYQVDENAPASTTGAVLNENLNFGYNGAFNVTVTSPTTFTYVIPKSVGSPATGTISLKSNVRVSGGIDVLKVTQSYTKQNTDDLWAMVVLDDSTVSKSRNITNDADFERMRGSDPRQSIIQNFSVYILAPCKNEIAARNSRDLMEDVMLYLFKSLLGFKPSTVLCEGAQYGVTFVSHDLDVYNESFFRHRFQFQNLVDLTFGDTLKEDIDVAFRDIHIDYIDPIIEDGDDVIMTSDINLDEEPIT